MAKKELPDGCRTLILSSSQAEEWGLKIGATIFDVVSHKLLNRQALLDDIKKSGKLSPWQPVRKQLEGYDSEEILIKSDVDEEYSEDGWVICLSDSARDAILEIVEPKGGEEVKEEEVGEGDADGKEEEEEEGEAAIPEEDESIVVHFEAVEARPRPVSPGVSSSLRWVSSLSGKSGSKRSLLRLRVRRSRRELGARPPLHDRDVDLHAADFRMRKDPTFRQRRVELGWNLQAGASVLSGRVDAGVQTQWRRTQARAVQVSGTAPEEAVHAAVSGNLDGAEAAVLAAEAEAEAEGRKRGYAGVRKVVRGGAGNGGSEVGGGGGGESGGGGGDSVSRALGLEHDGDKDGAMMVRASIRPGSGLSLGALSGVARRNASMGMGLGLDVGGGGDILGGGGVGRGGGDEDMDADLPLAERVASFLRRVVAPSEAALSQNETMDVLGSGVIDAAGGGTDGADAPLAGGGEIALNETRTIMDITHSSNCTVRALDWHPRHSGVLAAVPSPAISFEERAKRSVRSNTRFVVLYTLSDFGAVAVLESPIEVTTVRWSPTDPRIIVAGTESGQVVLWDVQSAMHRLRNRRDKRGPSTTTSKLSSGGETTSKASSGGGTTSKLSSGGGATSKSTKKSSSSSSSESGGETVHVRPLAVSHSDRSHSRAVTDLMWLPRDAHFAPRADDVRPEEDGRAYQFLSCSSDGMLLVWDVRFRERALAKSKTSGGGGGGGGGGISSTSSGGGLVPGSAHLTAAREVEVPWMPMYTAPVLAGALPLCMMRLSIDPDRPERPLLAVTEEGDVAAVDWLPPGFAADVDDVSGRSPGHAHSKDPTASTAAPTASASKPPEDSADHAAAAAGGGAAGARLLWAEGDHSRAGRALERNPFIPSLLAAVGEWSVSLWRIGVRRPIVRTPNAETPLTTARWSPSRPGVLFVGRSDGSFEVWDFAESTLAPALVIPAISTGVASLEFQGVSRNPGWRSATSKKHITSTATPSSSSAAPASSKPASSSASSSSASSSEGKRQLMAVGDERGDVHIFEVPTALRRPVPQEESRVMALIERETARLDHVADRMATRAVEKAEKHKQGELARAREDKARAAKQAEMQALQSSAPDGVVVDADYLEQHNRKVKREADDKAYDALASSLWDAVKDDASSLFTELDRVQAILDDQEANATTAHPKSPTRPHTATHDERKEEISTA